MKKIVIATIIIVIAIVASSFIMMWLWNLVMAGIFDMPKIDLLQAFGVSCCLGVVSSVFNSRK